MKDVECMTCLNRRRFLRIGALSYLGFGLRDYLELSSAMAGQGVKPQGRAQSCILIWLSGGPSQVDTWDPKTNSSFKPIATNVPGIQISELLPRVARHMDKLAVVRSMHTEENNHPEGTYEVMTGHRPTTVMRFPSFGSIVAKEAKPRNEVPAYVVTPPQSYGHSYAAGFLGPQYDPLVVPDPSKEDFKVADLSLPKSLTPELIEHRRSFLKVVDRQYRQVEKAAEVAKMDLFTEQALRIILSPDVKEAFDLSQETAKVRDAYGRTRFGQSVLLARRLVEAGSRFVTAEGFNHSEWDTHWNNDKDHRDKLVPQLDQALTTLLVELQERGLLESTVVIAMGEFGRTPDINPGKGRDHWCHCWSMVVGGGGIRGGQVIGASDERGAQVAERMVTIGDLYATVYKAFGIDWTKTYMGPGQRPIYIANSIGDKQGEPLKELM